MTHTFRCADALGPEATLAALDPDLAPVEAIAAEAGDGASQRRWLHRPGRSARGVLATWEGGELTVALPRLASAADWELAAGLLEAAAPAGMVRDLADEELFACAGCLERLEQLGASCRQADLEELRIQVAAEGTVTLAGPARELILGPRLLDELERLGDEDAQPGLLLDRLLLLQGLAREAGLRQAPAYRAESPDGLSPGLVLAALIPARRQLLPAADLVALLPGRREAGLNLPPAALVHVLGPERCQRLDEYQLLVSAPEDERWDDLLAATRACGVDLRAPRPPRREALEAARASWLAAAGEQAG